MLHALETLHAAQDLAGQAALFEAVLPRAEIRHYWVFHRMSRVYADLGRPDAGFLMAAMATAMQPDWDASHQPYRDLFRAFARRGDTPSALAMFEAPLARWPERPIVDAPEIAALTGAPPPPPSLRSSAADRRDHPIHAAEIRQPTPMQAIGGRRPHGLAPLATPLPREPVTVAELPGGELLILRHAVVVRDRHGVALADLSVCAYPEAVANRVLHPSEGEAVEVIETDQAVLIADPFPPSNLGHFLLDQISRLALYRAVGVDVSTALVVGPEIQTDYQRHIADRAGVVRALGTGRLARVRARRLWVSSECRALQHPAHLGAAWAIEHGRAILGGRGRSGSRRLYLSRADAAVRRVIGEPELVAMLSGHGFEAIVPGAMAYDAQLAAFRDASHVISAHGAALAHLLLCPPRARVLELFDPLYGSWAYAVLAAGCGLDYAAHVGRDGISDDPALNDPERVDAAAAGHGERHLRIDPAALAPWLEALG